MNDAARAQGVQHLKLIDDQGLDRKESETLNLYLPALAAGVKRRTLPLLAEFRRFVGLGVLEPLPFAVSIPELTEPFDPEGKFTVDISATADIKISYCGENFRSWVLDSIVEARAGHTLVPHALSSDASDEEILQDAARDDVDTDPAAIHYLVSQQPKGEEGNLLNDGKANILYVPRKLEEQGKIRPVRRTVRVYWGGRGWRFHANTVPDPHGWCAGDRVFLYKCLDTVAV